jgi:hypothetical protein
MKTPRLLILLLALSISLCAQGQTITVPQTQLSLITKRTATWCPNCADASAWDLKNRLISDLAGQALVISGHHSSSSRLYSPTAKDLIDNFQRTFSQPVFYFNSDYIGNGGSQTENDIKQRVSSAFSQSPLAQTGLRILFDDSKNLIEVQGRSTFFNTAEGDYYLGYYLVEKSVIETQSNLSSMADHKNVLREAISDGSFGEPLVSGAIAASSSFDFSKQYQFQEIFSPNNFLVAAILWKKNEADGFDLVNINTSDQFVYTVVTKTYGIKALNNYQLQPTITQNTSRAVIELESALPNATLSIYNWNGQLIQKIHQGSLTAGQHSFDLAVEAAGTYLVSLKSGQQVSTQRLIKVD